jgi:hypothetical protein
VRRTVAPRPVLCFTEEALVDACRDRAERLVDNSFNAMIALTPQDERPGKLGQWSCDTLM